MGDNITTFPKSCTVLVNKDGCNYAGEVLALDSMGSNVLVLFDHLMPALQWIRLTDTLPTEYNPTGPCCGRK